MAEQIRTELDEATGRQVIIYDDGTRKDAATGHFLSGPPAKQINSSERGRQLAQIARDRQALDKARAFARRQGVDVDNATTDELMAGFSKARETIHGKAYDLFMDAKTARGAEGLYPKLIQVGDERDERSTSNTINILTPMSDDVARFIADLHRMQTQQRTETPVNVIDGLLAMAATEEEKAG